MINHLFENQPLFVLGQRQHFSGIFAKVLFISDRIWYNNHIEFTERTLQK